jgi:hypothetical protein
MNDATKTTVELLSGEVRTYDVKRVVVTNDNTLVIFTLLNDKRLVYTIRNIVGYTWED